MHCEPVCAIQHVILLQSLDDPHNLHTGTNTGRSASVRSQVKRLAFVARDEMVNEGTVKNHLDVSVRETKEEQRSV